MGPPLVPVLRGLFTASSKSLRREGRGRGVTGSTPQFFLARQLGRGLRTGCFNTRLILSINFRDTKPRETICRHLLTLYWVVGRSRKFLPLVCYGEELKFERSPKNNVLDLKSGTGRPETCQTRDRGNGEGRRDPR